MPLTQTQQDALSRLQSYYEGNNPYNSVTNPGGFRQGGHVYNFVNALKDVALVVSGAASLVTDAVNAAASSPKAVRVDTAQSFTSAEQAQAQNNIGIAGALTSTVNKAGDTMSGALGLQYSSPQINLTQSGGTYDGNRWSVFNFSNDGKLYFQNVTKAGATTNPVSFGIDGSIVSAQFGDLNTYITNTASARVAKSGDTMSGVLNISANIQFNGAASQASPGARFYSPSVGDWLARLNTGNRFQLCDGGASVEYFSVGIDGSVSTKQFGDLNSRIESRAAAYASDARTGAINSVVTSTRMVYVGDQNVAANFNGGMHEDYGASWVSGRSTSLSNDQQDIIITVLRWRQLQQYIPNQGWVASYYA